MDKPHIREQFRYIVSGLLAFLVDYVTFLCVLRVIGLAPVISGVVSFVLGATTGFLLQRYWTFNKRSGLKVRRDLALYVMLAVFNLILTACILKVTKGYMPPEIAKFLTMVAIAIWNYFLYRELIFKNVA